MNGSIGESETGERLYSEALAAVERLRPRFPDDEELRRLEFTSHLNRCYIRGNAGRWREAAGDAARAHAFARRRLPKAPGDPGPVREYLGAANNLHLCLFHSGEKERSLDTLRERIDVLRRLQPPRPESPAETRELAQDLKRLGEVLDDVGRPGEAVEPLGEAIDLLTTLVRDPRTVPDARLDLESALRTRARVFESLGRSAEADSDRTRLSASPGGRP
jgi:tetratricopeptide (TPR) repeat protein